MGVETATGTGMEVRRWIQKMGIRCLFGIPRDVSRESGCGGFCLADSTNRDERRLTWV